MTAREQLKDPWGWLVAGIAGGVGWAVLAPLGAAAIPVGLAIGGAVLGTKVAIGSLTSPRHQDRPRKSQLPPPPQGSPQAYLLSRAEQAQRRIKELSETPGDASLLAQIGTVDDEVEGLVDERLADLAGRVTVADLSLASARPDVLQVEQSRSEAAVAAETDAATKAERQRTLAALTAQVEAVQRLGKLRQRLLSKMETAVVGLEGLAARMGELVALGTDPVAHDRSADVLDQLTTELDTVRSGLSEAEALSKEL